MAIKALLLTGALSIAAVSVAYATEGPGSPTDGTGPQATPVQRQPRLSGQRRCG
jgi:hypothetical protein